MVKTEATSPQCYIEQMFDGAPPAVSRQEIKRRTAESYSERTLANLDSQGKGIPGRFLVGNKVLYPLPQVVEWLKKRTIATTKPGA